MAKVDVETRGEVAVLKLSNPPVNALAHGVRQGLQAAVAAANADPAIKAIVVTGEGRAFSAGADITEFRSGMKPPGLGEVIDGLEASEKPVVAALNGLALGGGLEVALGCHYRVAAPSVSQLGLPEVKIGILPGAGGTQRLPRTIGVEAALDMIVSGNPINAAAAAKAGLVDRIAEGDVVDAAVAFARELHRVGQRAAPRQRQDHRHGLSAGRTVRQETRVAGPASLRAHGGEELHRGGGGIGHAALPRRPEARARAVLGAGEQPLRAGAAVRVLCGAAGGQHSRYRRRCEAA